jgi:hypothetical protein
MSYLRKAGPNPSLNADVPHAGLRRYRWRVDIFAVVALWKTWRSRVPPNGVVLSTSDLFGLADRRRFLARHLLVRCRFGCMVPCKA